VLVAQVQDDPHQGRRPVGHEAVAGFPGLLSGRLGQGPCGVEVLVQEADRAEQPGEASGWRVADLAGTVKEAVRLAKEAAGAKNVVVASSKTAQQCLDAGLLDAIHVDLVPVILGDGVRWFENLGKAPVRLDTPTVIAGNGVTHLAYPVTRKP